MQGEGEQVPAAPAEEDSRESDHAGQGSDAEEPETIPSDTEEGVEGGAPEPKVQGEQANNEADESEARVEVQQEEEGQGDRAEAQKGQVGGRTEQVEAVNGEQSGGDGNHEQQEGEDEEENKNRKKKKKTKKKKNRPPSTEAPNEQRAPPSVDQRGQLVTDSDNAIMVTEVDIRTLPSLSCASSPHPASDFLPHPLPLDSFLCRLPCALTALNSSPCIKSFSPPMSLTAIAPCLSPSAHQLLSCPSLQLLAPLPPPFRRHIPLIEAPQLIFSYHIVHVFPFTLDIPL